MNWLPLPARPGKALLDTTAWRRLLASTRGTALVFLELGGFVFIVSGIASDTLGIVAPLALLVVGVLGAALRTADLEGCALFIPGGLYGIVREGFGHRPARVAESALVVERLLFGALAAGVAGYYGALLGRVVFGAEFVRRGIATADAATSLAVGMLGAVWWWQRQGRSLSGSFAARAVSSTIVLLGLVTMLGIATAI